MNKFPLLILIMSLLVSCEKDKTPLIENRDMELISQILVNDEIKQEYSYNAENLVTEEKTKFTYVGHTYDDNNLLVKSEFYIDPAMFSSSSDVIEAAMNRTEWVNPSNTAKSLTHKLFYDKNNRLDRKVFIRSSTDESEYTTFTFEGDRIIRQSSYWHDAVSVYTDFFYDAAGNLVKEEKYRVIDDGDTQLETTTEYEFDTMKNPYYAFRRLITPGKYTNPNNIVKEIYTIWFEVDYSIDKVQTTEMTYEYNDKGYPVKVNGEVEYIYK